MEIKNRVKEKIEEAKGKREKEKKSKWCIDYYKKLKVQYNFHSLFYISRIYYLFKIKITLKNEKKKKSNIGRSIIYVIY